MKPKRFISAYFPMNRCNLSCQYCYIAHIPDYYAQNQTLPLYSPDQIAKCLRPERLGGCCLINLTGEGETLLQPDLVEICRLLLEEGHALEIVTNLTITKTLKELLAFPFKLRERLAFKISFHYFELKKRGLLKRFWDNVQLVQDSGCSFSLELMSGDQQIPYINEIIRECVEHTGAKCHVTVGRRDNHSTKDLLSELPREEYERTWSAFQSELFSFKMKLFGVKRREFCYAGNRSLFLNMHTGEARSCYAQPDSQFIFDDSEKPISFHPVGHHCVQPYCFNGHSFLALGLIPEIESPTYCDVRNRERADGSNWFSNTMKQCFSTKLIERGTDEFSLGKKTVYDIVWYFRCIRFVIVKRKKVVDYLKRRLEERR